MSKLLKLLFIFAISLFSLSAFAVAGPAITTPAQEGLWSTQGLLFVKWNAVVGATGYSYLIDESPDTIPDDEVETAETQANVPSKVSGQYYLHIKAKTVFLFSDTTHFKVNFDKENPEPPLNVTAVIEGDSVRISWDAAIDEGGSDINHYILYRGPAKNFSIVDLATKILSRSLKETTYIDEEIPYGAYYNYKLQAVDKAGNYSRPSSEVSITTPTVCQIDININFELKNKDMKIIVVSEGGTMFYADLFVTLPGKEKEQLADNYTGLTTFDKTVSLEGIGDGTILAEFAGNDSSLTDCNSTAEYILDNNKPSVSWIYPEESLTLTGESELKISASDTSSGSGIAKVEVFSGFDTFSKLGEAELKSGNEYVFDWNTFNYDNGRTKLKAIAYDKGGNTAEKIIVVSISNTLLQESAAATSISNAESKRQQLQQTSDIFSADSPIFNEKFNNLVSGADQNLQKAKDFLEKGINLERAKDYANNAASGYETAISTLGLEKYNSIQSSYLEEGIGEKFAKAGLKGSLIEEAKTAFSELLVTRRIDFYKINSDGNEFYIAAVVISFSQLSNPEEVKVVEIIPKEFAESALEVSSPQEITVLKDDPVISFGPIEGPRVSYSLNKLLTKDESDELIQGNIAEFFTAPPIILSGDTEVDSSTVIEPFDFNKTIKSITDLFSSVDPIIWVILVVAFVLLFAGAVFIALVGVIIYLLLRKR